jgi:DnaJ domain
MTFQGDPFRTLGVAPGASLNEIRSAYRRLAKQYHPDAAGERALPRFLAIQAAYEQLVDGEGRLRPPGWGSTAGRPGPSRPADPWRADPARARASRDAWRARRSGSGGTAGYRTSGGGATGGGARTSGGAATGGGSGSAPGGGAGGESRSAPGGGPGSRQASGPSSSGGERHRGARRGPRKATPGSTTYDEAAETPLDPAWDGGAWYGPSSGTYWTINPREYADPRKHGPEYLARARRAAGAASPAEGDGTQATTTRDPGAAPRTEAAGEAGDWQWTGSGATATAGGAAEWGARDWTYDAGDDAGAAWTPGPEGAPRAAGAFARTSDAGPGPADSRTGARGPAVAGDPAPATGAADGDLPDLEALVRRAFPEALLALATGPRRRWRLLLALAAWPPIAYALGGLVSTATGCAQYAASCPEPVPVVLLLLQPLVVAALYAVPVATAVGAFASLAALAVAIPAGAILAVGAMPRPSVEPVVLGAIVATTYVIALAAGAVRLWRGPAPTPRP